jgi:hypothetical protein
MSNITPFVSRGAIRIGMETPIRSVASSSTFLNSVAQAITIIGVQYCGASEESLTDPIFLKALYDELVNNFGGIGLNEIQEAFSMVGRGELMEIDGNGKAYRIDLTSYHGRLTVTTVTRVLAAYVKHRSPIVSEILKQQEAERQREQNDEEQKKKEAFKAFVLEWWNTATLPATYKDVKFYYYDALVELKKLRGDEMALSYCRRMAHIHRECELKDEKKRATTLDKERSINELFRALELGKERAHINNLGKQMYIWIALWKRREQNLIG